MLHNTVTYCYYKMILKIIPIHVPYTQMCKFLQDISLGVKMQSLRSHISPIFQYTANFTRSFLQNCFPKEILQIYTFISNVWKFLYLHFLSNIRHLKNVSQLMHVKWHFIKVLFFISLITTAFHLFIDYLGFACF